MKYTIIFFLALLTGCSSVMNQPEYKLPDNLSDQVIRPLSCNQYDVCSALYYKNTRPKSLKVAVAGEYHAITAATVWIDNQPFELTPTINHTQFGVTNSGQRISMRPFKLDQPLKERLNQATKVSLESIQQSSSITTVLKDNGFIHPEWRALLAGFN